MKRVLNVIFSALFVVLISIELESVFYTFIQGIMLVVSMVCMFRFSFSSVEDDDHF